MKILCVCYSLTGVTKAAVEKFAEIAAADVDVAFITEKNKKRGTGMIGMFLSGMDAMSASTGPIELELPNDIAAYDRVIVATPVWAGRCASPVRSFLKMHGAELKATDYIITRASEKSDYAKVFTQMDGYVAEPHKSAVSLRGGSDDYQNKLYDFTREVCGIK